MDMALVHNRDVHGPPVGRDPAPAETQRVREQPMARRAAAAEASARVARIMHETSDGKSSGFRYEVRSPGAVEIVMYSESDGSVLRRIPVKRNGQPVVPPSPVKTEHLDLRA
jgi:hypothetical protein